jgi:hypothetical protein
MKALLPDADKKEDGDVADVDIEAVGMAEAAKVDDAE